MIAGRLIDVITSKIESKTGKAEINDQIDYLEKKEILHGGSGGKITEAMKSYRNTYAHNIGVTPEIEEAITIIAGTSNLLKKMITEVAHQKLLVSKSHIEESN